MSERGRVRKGIKKKNKKLNNIVHVLFSALLKLGFWRKTYKNMEVSMLQFSTKGFKTFWKSRFWSCWDMFFQVSTEKLIQLSTQLKSLLLKLLRHKRQSAPRLCSSAPSRGSWVLLTYRAAVRDSAGDSSAPSNKTQQRERRMLCDGFQVQAEL